MGVGKALLWEMRTLSYVLPTAVVEGSAPTLLPSGSECGCSMVCLSLLWDGL